MGDDKSVDPAEIRHLASRLENKADELDRLGERMPTHVSAGVFAPHLTQMVNSAAANFTDLILRMYAMADGFRQSANYYESVEDANVEDVQDIFKIAEEDN